LQYLLLIFTVFEVLEGPIHGGNELKTWFNIGRRYGEQIPEAQSLRCTYLFYYPHTYKRAIVGQIELQFQHKLKVAPLKNIKISETYLQSRHGVARKYCLY
jgi:hypothetical protein